MAGSWASAATFGRVVPIGGVASDIALDERRGVLYIANYTSSRIDVMSLANNTIVRSIGVAAYPGALALSPDGQYLVVTHYASVGGQSLWRPGQDAVTVVELQTNWTRPYTLPSSPVGVAFGAHGLALILTQTEFLSFDPATGTATVVAGTAALLHSLPLPVPSGTYPPQIIAGELTASGNGSFIFGIAQVDDATLVRFTYIVATGELRQGLVGTAPALGPRVLSTSYDGSYYMAGWALFGCEPNYPAGCIAGGPLKAEWPSPSGLLNVGSVAVRSSKSLIYAQITPPDGPTPPPTNSETICQPNGLCQAINAPPSGSTTTPATKLPPTLLVVDSDNLTVRDRIRIPENLAGRSVFSADDSVLYSISDSGVTVFSMTLLDRAPRLTASVEDVVFRGNFCGGGPMTQTLDIADAGGNPTPFKICVAGSASCTAAGLTISPSSGVTPARVQITVDPAAVDNISGTKAYTLEIRSSAAVNMPPPSVRGMAETYVPDVSARFRLLLNNRVPENRGSIFNVPGVLVDVLPDPARNRFYVLRQDKNQVLVFDSTTHSQIATLRTSNTPTQMAITFDRGTLLVGHDHSQLAYQYDLNTLVQKDPVVFPGGHYPRSIATSARAIVAASRVVSSDTPGQIDIVNLGTRTAFTPTTLGPWENKVDPTATLVAAPNGGTILAAIGDGTLMVYSATTDSFVLARKDFSSLKGSYAASSYGNYMVDHYLFNTSLVPIAQVVGSPDSSSGFAFTGPDGISTAVRTAGDGYVQRTSSSLGQVMLPTGMIESPLTGNTDFPFTRTLAPLADRSEMVVLTTSGFTVLPWAYDAPTESPVIGSIVNAADFTSPVAAGGLISVLGSHLSETIASHTAAPVPTILGESCLTLNGSAIPMLFVSPGQINAQLPPEAEGSSNLQLHTPAGASGTMSITVQPTAPAVFRSGTAGPVTDLPLIIRAVNGDYVTNSNPIHLDDRLTIYLTGLGSTSPFVDAGQAATSDLPAIATVKPTVTLGNVQLPVEFAGLMPGAVGVYQIRVIVPFKNVPTGFGVALNISQGGSSTGVPVRVVE